MHLGPPAKRPRDVKLKRQTTVKKKQLNPEWDQHFELPLVTAGVPARVGSEADEVSYAGWASGI